jgi:PliI/PliC-like inhibitor of I-type lysozyme
MKTIIIASVAFLLTGLAQGSERNFRLVKKFQIPGSTEVVVVAEGDFEPRSTGSYSLRIYGGAGDHPFRGFGRIPIGRRLSLSKQVARIHRIGL